MTLVDSCATLAASAPHISRYFSIRMRYVLRRSINRLVDSHKGFETDCESASRHGNSVDKRRNGFVKPFHPNANRSRAGDPSRLHT